MRIRKFLVVGALCLVGCGASRSQSEGDLPAPTITPSIADTTTTTIGFSNIAIDIFPFQNSELAIGDCYEMAEFARPVDCSELHDGQVISLNTSLDIQLTSSTSEESWFDAIDEACINSFEDFLKVRYSYGDGQFVLDAIIKSADPLSINCTVIRSDNEKWVGSAEVEIGSYENVGFGDCFDPPDGIEDAVVIPCSKPHYAEMFLVDAKIGLDDIYAPYPTDDEWNNIQDRICTGPFMKYTGKSINAVDYSMALILPLESDWDDISSRTISCAITSGTGSSWSGSKRK